MNSVYECPESFLHRLLHFLSLPTSLPNPAKSFPRFGKRAAESKRRSRGHETNVRLASENVWSRKCDKCACENVRSRTNVHATGDMRERLTISDNGVRQVLHEFD